MVHTKLRNVSVSSEEKGGNKTKKHSGFIIPRRFSCQFLGSIVDLFKVFVLPGDW